MPISLSRATVVFLSGFAMSVAPLAVATIAAAPSWAGCGAEQTPDGTGGDCPPPPADPPPAAAPAPAFPGLPPLSPSDVKVNPPTFEGFNGGGVSWSWPQLCGPNIQTPIPFVGFQPCI
jgi:hypothetical protein